MTLRGRQDWIAGRVGAPQDSAASGSGAVRREASQGDSDGLEPFLLDPHLTMDADGFWLALRNLPDAAFPSY